MFFFIALFGFLSIVFTCPSPCPIDEKTPLFRRSAVPIIKQCENARDNDCREIALARWASQCAETNAR